MSTFFWPNGMLKEFPLSFSQQMAVRGFHSSLFFWSKYPMIDIYIRPPLLILVWSVLHIADRCFCRDFPTDCRLFFAPLFCLPMSVRSLFAPYWPFHPYSGSHPLKWDLRIYAQPKLPPVAPQTSFESKVKVFRLTDSLISVSVWPLRQFLMGHRSRPFNPDEPIE